MSYDPSDAARDDFFESIAQELYPEHKAQAISEFTAERRRSFYVANPNPKFQGTLRINRMNDIAKLEKLTSRYWEHP